MPKYTLTYFNGRGRAELTRLLFAASGTAYEDKRLEGDQWPKLKPNTPLGQLPLLEVDGVTISQSLAIARFVAREVNFYGSNNIEAGQIDMVVQTVADIFAEIVKFMFEKDEAKKAELQKNFVEKVIPTNVGYFSKQLSQNGSGFLVGKNLSLADLAVYDALTNVQDRVPNALANFADIVSYLEKIGNDPKIKEYVKNRPKTAF